MSLILSQEWRHAHGMRCLGIPNTAHFANVTLIEDAVACNVDLFCCYIIRHRKILKESIFVIFRISGLGGSLHSGEAAGSSISESVIRHNFGMVLSVDGYFRNFAVTQL